MVTDKVNINFNLRYPVTKDHPERKDQESPILVVVRWQNRKFKANIGQSILPRYWDDKKQVPKVDYRGADSMEKRKMREKDAQDLKDLLEVVQHNIKAIFNTYRTTGQPLPSLDQFKRDFKGASIYTKMDFFTFAQDLAGSKKFKRSKAEKEQAISPSTMRAYQGTINLVQEFCDYSGRRTLEFQDINAQFYLEFRDWMESKAVPKKRGKALAVGGADKVGYSANFVGRTFILLKAIMNQAHLQKLHTSTEFRKFEVPVKRDHNHTYLNVDELNAMLALKFTKEEETLEQVRDLFILGCFTGLRISDLTHFNDNAVINSNRTISIKTQKTGKWVHLPLPNVVEKILDKYNRNLPELSPQKFNIIIKEVAQRIPALEAAHMEDMVQGGNTITYRFKRWERVSAHTMRRSFATNAVTFFGLDPHTTMLITGHTDYEVFKRYVKMDELQAAARIAEKMNANLKAV